MQTPATIDRTKFKHSTAQLSNGLPVVFVRRPELHSVNITLFVRAGPLYETPQTAGLSHFLEHMLYRGTPSMPSAHHQALGFEELGATLYAATATDHGYMSLSLPPESLDLAISRLSEVTHHPLFSSIDIERGIVREEILEAMDDDGRTIDADRLIREELYGEHPLAAAITGTIAQLETFTLERVQEHHRKLYVAANSVIAVCGNFNQRTTLRSLEKSFGSLAIGTRASPAATAPLRATTPVRYVDNVSSQTSLRLAFRAPAEQQPLEPATEMLLRVIDDGMSTRVYERLCDNRGLCYHAGAEYETFCNDAIFDFSADTQHSRAPEVLDELITLCQELCDQGPTDRELDLARSRVIWGTRAMLDEAEGLSAVFGLSVLANVPTPAERCDQLLDVTGEQVRQAAQLVFTRSRSALVAVGLQQKTQLKRLEKLMRRLPLHG